MILFAQGPMIKKLVPYEIGFVEDKTEEILNKLVEKVKDSRDKKENALNGREASFDNANGCRKEIFQNIHSRLNLISNTEFKRLKYKFECFIKNVESYGK